MVVPLPAWVKPPSPLRVPEKSVPWVTVSLCFTMTLAPLPMLKAVPPGSEPVVPPSPSWSVPFWTPTVPVKLALLPVKITVGTSDALALISSEGRPAPRLPEMSVTPSPENVIALLGLL